MDVKEQRIKRLEEALYMIQKLLESFKPGQEDRMRNTIRLMLEEQLANPKKTLSEISSKIEAVKTSLQAELAEQKEKIQDVESSLTEFQTSVLQKMEHFKTIMEEVKNLGDSTQDKNEKAGKQKKTVDELSGELALLKSSVEELKQRGNKLDKEIEHLQEEKDIDNKQYVGFLEHQGLEKRVSELEKKLSQEKAKNSKDSKKPKPQPIQIITGDKSESDDLEAAEDTGASSMDYGASPPESSRGFLHKIASKFSSNQENK